jgi:hypothetical protein
MSEEIEPHLKIKAALLFHSNFNTVNACTSASSVSAYNVQVTNKYVKATALCSCGLNSYHYIDRLF